MYALADARLLLEGRYVDDEIIVWTPDGRYDATAEGAHFAYLKFPGRYGQYTFQQFDKQLKVSGLVQKVLSGKELNTPTFAAVNVPPNLKISLATNENGRIEGEAAADTDAGLSHITSTRTAS